MILDAIKFGRGTFFPYKFMGLFRRCRPRGTGDANFWTRFDLAQDTVCAPAPPQHQQSVMPGPLPHALPQRLGQRASPRVASVAVSGLGDAGKLRGRMPFCGAQGRGHRVVGLSQLPVPVTAQGQAFLLSPV